MWDCRLLPKAHLLDMRRANRVYSRAIIKTEMTLHLDPETVRQAQAICETLPEEVTVSSLISRILSDFVEEIGPVAEAAKGGDPEAQARLRAFNYGGPDRDTESE